MVVKGVNRSKGKVVPDHALQPYRESRGVALGILILSAR